MELSIGNTLKACLAIAVLVSVGCKCARKQTATHSASSVNSVGALAPEETRPSATSLASHQTEVSPTPRDKVPDLATPLAEAALPGKFRSVLKTAQSESAPPVREEAELPLEHPSEVLPLTPLPSVEPDASDSLNEDLGRLPLDLGTALQITAGQNPQVVFARQRIQEAMAQLQSAEVLWVPSLRAGANYNKHEGPIQDVEGVMIETSRGSIYTGLGAQVVGAGSPAVPGILMNFHVSDAIFLPRVAEQRLAARRHASRAETNDIMTETALAYIGLLEALQLQEIARQTLENTRQLVELTAAFADTGQGLRADADRAQAEHSVREIQLRRTGEEVRVASVRLTRLLSHDATLQVEPIEPALTPIHLVPLEFELPELVATGLSNRPELAESRSLVGEMVELLRRERNAPLVPSVLLGLSYGGNGGGLGSTITGFGDRLDFDAVAFWEVRNLGFGEQAARNQARSRVDQARSQQVQVMDRIASEVAEAHAQLLARETQIGFAQEGIWAAMDSHRLNTERIRDAQGLPIETLQSIQALEQAQREYVRTVADYNRAQFSLQRALGWPVSFE